LQKSKKICIIVPVLGGAGANGYTVEIVWHRRETRRQTEKTNINLVVSEETGLLDSMEERREGI
jgi:hypothetical protein